MKIFKDKMKAYRYVIIVGFVLIIITGTNYLIFKGTIMGIVFVIVIASFIINICAYFFEKRSIKKN